MDARVAMGIDLCGSMLSSPKISLSILWGLIQQASFPVPNYANDIVTKAYLHHYDYEHENAKEIRELGEISILST